MAFFAAIALALGASTASGLILNQTPNPLTGSNFQGGDGNQADGTDSSGNPVIDWEGLEEQDPPLVHNIRDLGHPGPDDHFAGGNAGKELEPGNWAVTTQGSLGNSAVDILNVYHVFTRAPNGDAFFYLGATRFENTGTSWVTFELNHRTPRPNGLPCRTDGDLLISLDQNGTSSTTTTVEVQKWQTTTTLGDGCASTGTLVPVALGNQIIQGAINYDPIRNFLPGVREGIVGATIGARGFVETAINLTGLLNLGGEQETCGAAPFFSFWAHSRTSDEVTSDLKDFVAPVDITANPCPVKTVTITKRIRGRAAHDRGNIMIHLRCRLPDGSTTPVQTFPIPTAVEERTVAASFEVPHNATRCRVTEPVNGSNDLVRVHTTFSVNGGPPHSHPVSVALGSGEPAAHFVVTDTYRHIPAPAISVTKTASPTTFGAVGETITYRYVVTNTGNVPLSGIILTDSRLGRIDCPLARLLPGRSMDCTATHVTTVADARRGHITNTATVVGHPPRGEPVDDSALARVRFVPAAAISLTKSASPTTYGAPGETITYTYVVTNTGNVPLRGIVLTDNRLGTITCPRARLLPGRSMDCTVTHVTTVADVRRGHISNTATVTGFPPSGLPVDDTARARVRFIPAPSITLTKSASPTTYGGPGETITYTYVVTNSGNVPLSGIVLTDSRLGDITCPTTRLLPGRSMACEATYVTTVADVRAGQISNAATVTGTAPDGTEEHSSDEETVTFVPAPGISVSKTASPTTYGAPGETITYTYVVTNSGNVPLRGITLSDSVIGTVTCPHTALLPGRSMTCTATYVTTVADMRVGRISNAATVTGQPPTGPPVDDSDEATVNAVRTPAISLTKTASPTTYGAQGETITYTYLVTNSGNVPLSGITLADSRLGGITCPATRLLPGRSMTCTATHVTTAADLDAGNITNTATVTGMAPDGTGVSDSDEATVTAVQTPAISVSKSASPTTYRAAGETITYTFVVTNSGNTTLSNVTLTDSRLGAISCPATTLAAGQSMTCTATHVTTVEDVRAGHITNASTVTGQPPTGPPVSDSAEADVAVEHPAPEAHAAMQLVKTASVTSFTRAGQLIIYKFRVTNTGDVRLTGITLTDDKLGKVACPDTSLAIGAHMDCFAAYTTTSADVRARHITNVGIARALIPSGAEIRARAAKTLPFAGAPAKPPAFTG